MNGRRSKVTVTSLQRDYSAAEKLIDDLAFGSLDLKAATQRIRDLYDIAFTDGARAHAEGKADKTAQLAAENRRLRERLVSQSLQIKQQEGGASHGVHREPPHSVAA